MKKKMLLGATAVMMALSVLGCGTNDTKSSDGVYDKYVKLGTYKGVEAPVIKYDVTDEEVQEEVQMSLYQYAEYTDVTDREVKDNDYVNITYTGTLDGEPSEDYSGEEEEYQVGYGSFFDEVEKALIGVSIGDTISVEFDLTADNAYFEEDAGKKVAMEITLNGIFTESLPEYNDEFVTSYTDYSNTEEYEESVKQSLLETKESDYKSYTVGEIMEKIVDASEFDGYPEDLYAQCEANYESTNAYYAQMYGMELDEYYETFEIDDDTKKEDILSDVHYELVARAIAEKEGISVSQDDIDAFVEDNYEDYGYETKEAFFQDYTNEEIEGTLLYDKVMEFLYENVKGKEMSEEEYLQGDLE